MSFPSLKKDLLYDRYREIEIEADKNSLPENIIELIKDNDFNETLISYIKNTSRPAMFFNCFNVTFTDDFYNTFYNYCSEDELYDVMIVMCHDQNMAHLTVIHNNLLKLDQSLMEMLIDCSDDVSETLDFCLQNNMTLNKEQIYYLKSFESSEINMVLAKYNIKN